jgi:hypothetical protein
MIKTSDMAKKKSFTALMSSVRENLDDIRPLYDRVCAFVLNDPFLSERIMNVVVAVKPERISSSGKAFPKAFQIWAVHQSGPAEERKMGEKLAASVNGKLVFAGSGNFKTNLERDGVEIVEEMESA